MAPASHQLATIRLYVCALLVLSLLSLNTLLWWATDIGIRYYDDTLIVEDIAVQNKLAAWI